MTRIVLHGFLLLTLSYLSEAASTTSPSLTASSICPSRTVNYITQGLPQQCLASSRSPGLNTTTTQDHNSATMLSTVRTSTDETNDSAIQERASGETKNEEVALTSSVQETTSILEAASAVSDSPPFSKKAVIEDDADADLALGNEKFLSFEDWRKQNLLRAGQLENLGNKRPNGQRESRKRPANLHSALDSIGDDAEIDLDFTGFLPAGPDLAGPKLFSRSGQEEEPVQEQGQELFPPPIPRGKDAGTTSKERFNYASYDCAANVLKTNKEAKSPYAVLGENKDSYMLNECSANNKFLILELCNDLQIDTIVLANFEFFSSTFRTFRVSVSGKYPVKVDKWETLGLFEARNSREVQAFLVENPLIWTRFVRIEFLTHYGSEFYCPVSLVRVHGTTMLEEVKDSFPSNQGEDDEEDVDGVEQLDEQEVLLPEPVAEILAEEKKVTATHAAGDRETSPQMSGNPTDSSISHADSTDCGLQSQFGEGLCCRCGQNAAVRNRALLLYPSLPSTSAIQSTLGVNFSSTELRDKKTDSGGQLPTNHNQTPISIPAFHSSTSLSGENQSKWTGAAERKSTTLSVGSSEISSKSSNPSTAKASSSSVPGVNGTSSEKLKASPSSTHPVPAAPTMQESFFKSVQKRLQVLETSSSLSLQYIEEQSRALRDAFTKVEQRQLAKTGTFLDYLNSTVLSELRDFRQQYDQLWQSTVIELDMQREQFQSETVAINIRLGVLADEVIFQKRMAILQMILIVVCLGLILFSRGHMNSYLELPIVQSMLARSPSSKWVHIPGLETPSQSPAISRPSSSHKMKPDHGILKGHGRHLSENSVDTAASPVDPYSPLTSTSYDEASDGERRDVPIRADDPIFDPSTIERPNTSPPVLPSGDGPVTPGSLPALVDQIESIESRLLELKPRETPGRQIPRVNVEDATARSKHLTWQLPDS